MTARKMGNVFYNLGFLGSDAVVECSASDLIGEYVGQTGPKVVSKFDEAVGKVLFVDEAYRLGEGTFAKEAVDEVVDCLTKERYKSKMLVILAGYEEEINRLLQVNPGLTSRFAEDIMFEHFTPTQSVELLVKRLQRHNKLKLSLQPESNQRVEVEDLFARLSQVPGWANGRDVESLATRIVAGMLKSMSSISSSTGATWNDVIFELSRMLAERQRRLSRTGPRLTDAPLPIRHQTPSAVEPKPTLYTEKGIESSGRLETFTTEDIAVETRLDSVPVDVDRDAGVTEEVWQQLCADIATNQHQEIVCDQTINELRASQGRSMQRAQDKLAEAKALKNQAIEDDGARQLWEAARLQALAQKREAEDQARRLRQLEEERQRMQEQERKVQQRLRQMGLCVAGFRWIKQSGGYRCAGGSHFVSDSQLGL